MGLRHFFNGLLSRSRRLGVVLPSQRVEPGQRHQGVAGRVGVDPVGCQGPRPGGKGIQERVVDGNAEGVELHRQLTDGLGIRFQEAIALATGILADDPRGQQDEAAAAESRR